MKAKFFVCLISVGLFSACSGNQTPKNETPDSTSTTQTTEEKKGPSDYDPKRGEGKYDETNVKIGELNVALASKGEGIANTKCTSCHKLTDEKLVGPGWKGVTERRKPHWIMNFITNPDPMIDKDPEVKAQLELCMVRMPNQNLNEDEARQILEFMRKNDGVK